MTKSRRWEVNGLEFCEHNEEHIDSDEPSGASEQGEEEDVY